jgi:hypothetical protein
MEDDRELERRLARRHAQVAELQRLRAAGEARIRRRGRRVGQDVVAVADRADPTLRSSNSLLLGASNPHRR